MLRCAADLFLKRCKYFGIVPWAFVLADTVAGAAACVQQVNERPLCEHDRATQDIWGRLQKDIEARAAGGEVTPALAEEVRILGHTPLDEGCGEGYHRDTSHEKIRAPSAATAHLKQHTRIKGVIKTFRKLCADNGRRGKAVVNYERKHWTRILQTARKYRWRGKQMKAKAVFARIYREDAKGSADWSSICQRLQPDRPVPEDAATSREQLEREYLTSVFKPLEYYTVESQTETQNEAGEPEIETTPITFQLLEAQAGVRRDKVMHTVQSADDPLLRGGLALHVVFQDTWDHPEMVDDGKFRVYAEGDDEWVLPQRIASFEAFSEHMVRYSTAQPDPEHHACMVLSDPYLARPRFPIEDERCPTLALVRHLKQVGWIPRAKFIEHTVVPGPADHGEFDSREAVRMKYYYRALIELAKCLPLTDQRMPSQHPVAYYKLLLRGMHAVPDQTAKQYTLTYNRSVKDNKKKGALLPLPPPGPDPIPGADEVFVAPIGAPEPKAKSRSSGPGIRGRGRGRGSGPADTGGRGGGGTAPPVPVEGPEPPPAPGPRPPPGRGEGGGGAPDPLPVDDGEEDMFVPPLIDDPPRRAREPGDFVDAVNGCKMNWKSYVTPAGRPAPNFKIKCPYHYQCYKSRGSTDQFCSTYGAIEPIAYLHAWAEIPWPTTPKMGTHRQEAPSDDEVLAMLEAHRHEFEELLSVLHP